MTPLIKARELAEKLAVDVATVRRWSAAGAIPHTLIGNVRRYDLAKVLAALESKKVPQ